jgi:putative sterol carrier protein
MAVDTIKLFNEQLPAALERNAQDARTINAKFQLVITGAGEWFVDVTESGPSCVPGNPGGSDCMVTMADEDFQKLHESPQSAGMQLFFSGKLKVQGNTMLAMKLAKLFSYT